MALRFVPDNTKIDFMRWRKTGLSISSIINIGALLLCFYFQTLNLGIDFLGGTLMEVKTIQGKSIGDVRAKLSDLGLGEITLQEFGGADLLLIRAQRQPGGDDAQLAAVQTMQTALKDLVVEFRRVEFVGPTVGKELQMAAFWATLGSILAIIAYIWLRFEWYYGVSGVVALLHDVIATLGLFAITGMEFNMTTIAALLTLAGYSINDTVVIFDRVRENLQKFKKMSFLELANRSINDTLSRTIMTSMTTELALIALLLFGGEAIRGFALAMVFGVFVGTYSSYFIALPMLYILRPKDTSYQATASSGTNP